MDKYTAVYIRLVNRHAVIQACAGAMDWKRLFRGAHTWQVSLAMCFYGSVLCIIFLLAVFIITKGQQWPIRRVSYYNTIYDTI